MMAQKKTVKKQGKAALLLCVMSYTWIYIVTVVVVAGYPLVMYLLKKNGIINQEQFIGNLTIFIGWIIALLIAAIHLHKSRVDNRKAQREKTRKELELEAFREINLRMTQLSQAVAKVCSLFGLLPLRLSLCIDHPEISEFSMNKRYEQITTRTSKVAFTEIDFATIIEAHEIAVMEFIHLTKFIHFRLADAREEIDEFIQWCYGKSVVELGESEGETEFKNRCAKIEKLLFDITFYLYDMRIKLMNSLVGDIFERHIPIRKPEDPTYRVLTEIATKENVAKEEAQRIQRDKEKACS
jgi:hypothetical protein